MHGAVPMPPPVGLGAVLLHALAPAALRVYAPWLLLGLAFCAGLGLGAVVWRAVYGESAMSGTPLGYLSVALGSASSTRDATLLPAEARVEPPHPPRARLAHWPASHLAPASHGSDVGCPRLPRLSPRQYVGSGL
jgi:hypothetical protein